MNYLDLVGPVLIPLLVLSVLGCFLLFGAQKASSSLRRLIAAAFLLSLAVVLASPGIKLPAPPVTSVTNVEQAAVQVSTQARNAGPWPWLAFVPAVCAIFYYLSGLIGLALTRPHFFAGPNGLTSDRLFVCPKAKTAYAYGAIKPTIVLPASYLELEPAALTAIIRHEEAHLRQGDPTLIPIVHLIQGLLWWNPFVHLLAHAWRVESERAADDAALASGIAPARYARQLIALAQGLAGRTPLAGSAFIGRGRLKTRILAVVNPEIRRKNMKVSHKYMTVAGCMAVALALSVAASARWNTAQVVNEKGVEGVPWKYVETKPGHFIWTQQEVEGRPLAKPTQEVEGWRFHATDEDGQKLTGKVVKDHETLNEIGEPVWVALDENGNEITGTLQEGKVWKKLEVSSLPENAKK